MGGYERRRVAPGDRAGAYTDAHVARPVLAVAYSPQAVTWRGYRLARNGQSERDCQWATVQQR